MPNMHKQEFDSGTDIKLALYKSYMKAWLPIMCKTGVQTVYIYDLFAGPGKDAKGNSGSPLILLDILMKNCPLMHEGNLHATILFNDKKKRNITQLQNECRSILEHCKEKNQCNHTCPFNIIFKCNNFKEIFPEITDFIKTHNNPFSFMFLDQYGIKHVNTENFLKLVPLLRTDILFFSASADVWRFRRHPTFKKYIETEHIPFKTESYPHCHKLLVDYYRSLVPLDLSYKVYLAPFSIKKESSGMIYGLTFISHNLLGLEKFVSSTWQIDAYTGEANYNINDDKLIKEGQPLLFEWLVTKKLDYYESALCSFLQGGKTNCEVYEFSLINGIVISKTTDILRKLETDKKIRIETIGDNTRRKNAYYLRHDRGEEIRIYYE